MVKPFCLLALLAPLFAACGAAEPEAVAPALGAFADAVPIPERVLRAARSPDQELAFYQLTPTLVYVNFDGQAIVHGWSSDATTATSFIGSGGAVPAFSGSPAQRDAIMTRARGLFQAYNIAFVTERPAAGDYAMVVVGGEPADIGYGAPDAVVGVAPLDCDDRLQRDIVFVFAARIASIVSAARLAREVAETMAHELGHAFGLPHTTAPCDVMSYGRCSAGKVFSDASLELAEDAQGSCGLQEVDPHQHLRRILGDNPALPAPPAPPPPPPADLQPPTVAITEPTAGARVVGPALTLTAEAEDDVGVTAVELRVDGALLAASALGGQPAVRLSAQLSLPAGEHLAALTVFDAARNEGTAGVRFEVAAAPDLPPPAPEPPAPEPPAPEPPAPVSCSYAGRTGVCQDIAAPCAGSYQAGLCPGPSAIRCCVSWGSCLYAGQQGRCQRASESCGGQYRSGLCPGPADVRCCLP